MDMAGRYTVLLLRVAFKYEIERTANDISRIHRAINRSWCYPAMHSKRAVAFVILSEESERELVDRVRPTLDRITGIENYWCHIMASDVAAMNGDNDTLTCYVREAWQELGKRNKPNYVRQPERAEPIVIGRMKDFDSRTAIEMGIKAPGMGKAPKDSDRKQK
jgi:hypothetical protein